jgi:predicted phage baseplate assembly protein
VSERSPDDVPPPDVPIGIPQRPPLGTRAETLARLIGRLHDYVVEGEDAPPLARLNLDAPDDPALALVDAWASVRGVLAFYQERIRGEGYLGTARQERSLRELGRMLGVAPAPALSARADVVFTHADTRSTPDDVVLPKGAAVQSIPASGGQPAIFETSAELRLRAEWNQLTLRTSAAVAALAADARGVMVSGGALAIAAGDVLLMTGRVRGTPWEAVKTVRRVGRARKRNRALLAWDEPLDARLGSQPITDVEAWIASPPEPLNGHDAPRFTELDDKRRLRHSRRLGGVHRFDADAKRWLTIEQGDPGMVVLTLAAGPAALVLIGVDGGGLQRSTDGGASWRPAGGGTLARADVLCVVEDDQGRLVAGTRRHGVHRSCDGGRSWEQLRGRSAVVGDGLSRQRLDRLLPATAVRSLAPFIAGAGAQARSYVLAGTDDGVFVWEDGGSTWTPVNGGLPLASDAESRPAASVRAVAIERTRSRLYAGTDRGLFACASLGGTWKADDPGAAGGAVAALVLDDRGTLTVALDNGSLYQRGVDARWQKLAAPLAGRALSALVARTPSDGGATWLWAAAGGGVFRSADAGASFAPLGEELPGDVTALALTPSGTVLAATPLMGAADAEWPGWPLDAARLDLSRVVARATPGDPLLLVAGTEEDAAPRRLLRIVGAAPVDVTDFGARRRVTRLAVQADGEGDGAADLSAFDRRRACVRLGGARLVLAPEQARQRAPIADPRVPLDDVLASDVEWDELVREPFATDDAPADELTVKGVIADLTGRVVMVSGQRLRARANTSLEVATVDGLERVTIEAGQVLELMGRPTAFAGGARWPVRTERGFVGTIAGSDQSLTLLPPAGDAEPVVERRMIESAAAGPTGTTRLRLDTQLGQLLWPASLRIEANVVEATHGRTISEVLGTGSGAPDQSFPLKRKPLTWLATDDGIAPQIEVLVGKQPWRRVDGWGDEGPTSRVFVVSTDATGAAVVSFGDGQRGAVPATGGEILAVYRSGAGSDGMLGPDQLRLVRTRPLGVKPTARNPLPSVGAVDAEAPGDLRERIPCSTLTLGRIVSRSDFTAFARAFPGVARARTRSVWNGHAHLLAVTIASTDEAAGWALADDGPLARALGRALQAAHAGGTLVQLVSCEPRWFDVKATLWIDRTGDAEAVDAAARAALVDAFGFARRELAQSVAVSEVIGVLAAVDGVCNARVDELRSDGMPGKADPAPPYIAAVDSHWDARRSRLVGAELLLLNARTGISLDVRGLP